MKKIKKELELVVYTPTEVWNNLLEWHDLQYFTDKVLVDGKISIENLHNMDDKELFYSGLGVCDLQEYLNGWCNYFSEDFQEVFEQDNKLYVLSYLP